MKIVLSGINMIDGGALSIYYDCLEALIKNGYIKNNDITIFVGNKKLFKKYEDYFEIIELPKSKKNWIFRLYYEFLYFKKYSKKLKIDIWISLHDITPNVVAKQRYVYCHNPSPFNKMKISDIKYGFKYFLFSKFYKYLYFINIKKNTNVIVQQNWIKKEFEKMFKINNVIVARPSIDVKINTNNKNKKNDEYTFIYPSIPRYYKNFELVCKASKKMINNGINKFKVVFTFDGTENTYSKEIVKKYREIEQLKFIGVQKRNKLYQIYQETDCLLFTSKLETWGMPIIEYKTLGKPMIVADLPYAKETVGNYKNVIFSDVNSDESLYNSMKHLIKNKKIENSEKEQTENSYLNDWKELLLFIINQN